MEPKQVLLLQVRVDKVVGFGLVSLFNGISTFMGYLMPKPSILLAVMLFNP